MTNTLPVDELERRAETQRRDINRSISELRAAVRDTLDVKRNAREHMGAAAGTAAAVGLVLGWMVAGMFTRH